MVCSSLPTSRNSAVHHSGLEHCNLHQDAGPIESPTADPHQRMYAGHIYYASLLFGTMMVTQMERASGNKLAFDESNVVD